LNWSIVKQGGVK